LVYYVEQSFIFGNVGHRSAVVSIADSAICIHNADERHASEFEEIDYLTILDGDAMTGIGQAEIGNIFLRPVLLKGGFSVGTNSDDLCVALLKFSVIVFHTRQRRAAIWSHEAAQESQHHGLFAAKIGQAHEVAVDIVEFKFGSELAWGEKVSFHEIAESLDEGCEELNNRGHHLGLLFGARDGRFVVTRLEAIITKLRVIPAINDNIFRGRRI
jgi:hypothetical protein